jgi:hypothetical protein
MDHLTRVSVILDLREGRGGESGLLNAIRTAHRGEMYVHPTVESHRANLMSKLGLQTRVQLVRYAAEHKLLE